MNRTRREKKKHFFRSLRMHKTCALNILCMQNTHSGFLFHTIVFFIGLTNFPVYSLLLFFCRLKCISLATLDIRAEQKRACLLVHRWINQPSRAYQMDGCVVNIHSFLHSNDPYTNRAQSRCGTGMRLYLQLAHTHSHRFRSDIFRT